MGNTQSASSTRHEAVSRDPETNGGPLATSSTAAETTATSQPPTEQKEDNASRAAVGRRRSLLKFPSIPSLRKKHSVVGISDEGRAEGSMRSSPSRRRWRAFSGLKHRPISTITDSGVPATNKESLTESSDVSKPEDAPSEKGKEHEAVADPEPVEPRQTDNSMPGRTQTTSEASNIDLERHGENADTFSSGAVLRQLRELQDAMATGSDSQSGLNHDSGGSRDHVQRPPTPVPTSTFDSFPLPQNEIDGHETGPSSTLGEALGTWLSGSSREPAEASSNGIPLASGSHSQSAGASSFNNSAGLGTLPPQYAIPHSDVSGSIPSSSMSSVRPMDNNRFGRGPTPGPTQPDRRTLPPTNTGTLVVVQGVVHTTDVRHDHPHSPSRSQTTPAGPTRSSSSTPTLRVPSAHASSQSPTRPSTPQAQLSPRRGRFSSLTNSLRPGSRPGTATSRISSGTIHNPLNPSSRSEPSEPNDVFLSSADSSTSESENSLASVSSAGPSTPIPDVLDAAPVSIDSQGEIIDAIDALPLPEQSPARMEAEDNRPNGDPSVRADGNDGDVSEDESEAELSASSIEVLGTLLSVATAATAASLVTGTTDPLFSSGLASPGANVGQRQTESTTQSDSNSSPTPLSFDGPSRPESGIDTNAEAAVNTRMRAAWESLRDRFSRTRGRRGAASGDTEEREDPREQMLREMARAFNTGLGLNAEDGRERWEAGPREGSERAASESTATPDVSSPPGTSLPERESQRGSGAEPVGPGPGPEGSFERFLHNLQVDLRTALTEDYAARRARAQGRDSRSATDTSSPEISAPTSTASTETPPGSSVTPSQEQSLEGQTPSLGNNNNTHNTSPLDPTPNTPRPVIFDLPSLPGATAGTSPGSEANNTPPQAHGITGQPGAGINWWRLYRFPPMQLAPHPSSLPAGGLPATQRRTSHSDSHEASSGDGVIYPLETPTSTNTGTAHEPSPGQNVVPVIVVGLQSVPTNRRDPHQRQHQHRHDSPPSFDTHGLDNDSPSDLPVRERPWPLRAASRAFGRMGRRGDAEPPASDGTSSGDRPDPSNPGDGRQGGRTYLIFVIGGYYPPNHSIVTGSDDMNSFEALWELAELLGQVKPPVASKEEIEKSGLEILKASNISNYEQAGKIASNTVERCLICLDDYAHEDDLRLLSCRHVFHKQCVDKWLEQGRNNCPACRTKGVRTGDESPPTSPTYNRE